MSDWLRDALLEDWGVGHGFGLRSSPELARLHRPRQVHGSAVVELLQDGDALGDADAILCRKPGLPIGVVTADCVPVLVAGDGGAVVAAIHAGWRGLAAGVVEAGVASLVDCCPGAPLRAAIGPCAGPCCYEVDEPVIDALNVRYTDVTSATRPSRHGHVFVDLSRIVAGALERAGVEVGRSALACTICQPGRFHSHRRDGDDAGRLAHWIAARVRR